MKEVNRLGKLFEEHQLSYNNFLNTTNFSYEN